MNEMDLCFSYDCIFVPTVFGTDGTNLWTCSDLYHGSDFFHRRSRNFAPFEYGPCLGFV